jgi:serine/threonine-protein kinase
VQQQDTVLNGRYRLGDVLGEGGMAVVYRGHDLLLNRPVAIKILRSQYASDESFLRRFEREAQSAAGFSHPNIVNVYDVGKDGDRHYIVMEYIRGPSLKELIRRQGPFSVDGAVFIIGQVASALDYAHQRALVHRDIKPQNILVDRDGNAKGVDFGIAKGMRDVNLTEAGTGMGTVHYVSPEQARGEPATPASDLYSTGVVLFEMLTKQLPFEADSPVGVAMQHVNTTPPAPSTINPAIPPAVDAIVLKALAKEPQDRYPSGAALASALRHWDMPLADQVPRNQRTEAIRTPRAAPPPPRGAAAGARGSAARRQGTGQMRLPGSRTPPPAAVKRGNRGAYPPAQARANRDDVGCVTWLIGSAILLGIIGLVLLAFRVGPGVFSSGSDATPTVTQGVTATVGQTPAPTQTVAAPTSTLPVIVPTATAQAQTPTATATSPAPTPTQTAAAVPSLIGMTIDDARATAGDRWSVVASEQPSNSVPSGQIISQDPPAGTALADGETITVTVSTGPSVVSIPDLRGLDAAAAQAQLEALGLDVAVVEEESEQVAEGLVIRTEPRAEAPAGSTVTLVVSSGPPDSGTVVVPYVFGQPFEDGVAKMEAAGLPVTSVTPLSCNRIHQLVDPAFDCAGFPDGGIVTSTQAWNATVAMGETVDLTYYDASL